MNGDGARNELTIGEPANEHILKAIDIVYDPRSTNELRKNASEYLEEVKRGEEAPYHGYVLASHTSQRAEARYYGLALLEYAIRYRWVDYTAEQSLALRNWVLKLAESVAERDPSFLRNKVAGVWVELAKRSWAVDWMDMDEVLVRLWSGSIASKEVVLTILEALSEDIFGREDALAGLRDKDLGTAFVDIFTPSNVLSVDFPFRETGIYIRYGEEGWVTRMGGLLDWCIRDEHIDAARQACSVKVLGTLKSAMSWIIAKALATTQWIPRLCQCLASPSLPIQLASVDVFYSFYNRPRFSEEDFNELVCPMYRHETINLLSRIYEWAWIDADDIDSEKYLLAKKFSEMIFNVGRLLEERPTSIPKDRSDLNSFYKLLIDITKNHSLHVSIPAVHLLGKILASERIGDLAPAPGLVAELLEVCSHRLIRYECLPEDSPNPSIIFLNHDVDTMPERHAFLGNYMRFCKSIVETIVLQQPADAVYHILGQAEKAFSQLYDEEPAFSPKTYCKNSVPFLRLDAQCTVIEAALKGCGKWLSGPDRPQTDEILIQNLQVWCERILDLIFEDPLVKQRIIQLAVGFATGPLKKDARFAFKVFQYILDTRYQDDPTYSAYSEAVKELQGFCIHELQRLAMRFPDYLITIFDEVEQRVNQVCQAVAQDEHTRMRYFSILFIITHRATTVDPKPREQRLDMFLQPLISQWHNEGLSDALASFQSFCTLIGCGGIQQYMSERAVHEIPDWSLYGLDDKGRDFQAQMQQALEHLPLRATKTMLTVSFEKMEPDSRPHEMACRLWQKSVPLILPNLIQSISQAHAFHNPGNWAMFPPESGIVRKILTDRFWQVGISTGSRDEFYARVGDTKSTLEGLASSIRATVRTMRETGYRILGYMSLLGEHFYSLRELPVPLSRALFQDVFSLSTHQITILVDAIRPVIEHCPVASRSHFLPPILSSLFEQLDRKASAEWDSIEQRSRGILGRGSLDEEMRDESILRQMTTTSVVLVVGLLDPDKHNPPDPRNGQDGVSNGLPNVEHGNIRSFILATPEILKPLILFCTHALRMRDTRSSATIARVLTNLVPEFDTMTPVDTDVREYISTEVLKACIESLHEPYFVDLQKELAQLIARIVITYTPRTSTPKQTLLSLPSMTEERVDRALQQLYKAHANHRQQRSIVLDLLEGLRGVSVSEQGRVPKPDQKKPRSVMQQQYMTIDMQADGKPREKTPDLSGVADMFGQH